MNRVEERKSYSWITMNIKMPAKKENKFIHCMTRSHFRQIFLHFIWKSFPYLCAFCVNTIKSYIWQFVACFPTWLRYLVMYIFLILFCSALLSLLYDDNDISQFIFCINFQFSTSSNHNQQQLLNGRISHLINIIIYIYSYIDTISIKL